MVVGRNELVIYGYNILQFMIVEILWNARTRFVTEV